jgi:hypothetical protein
VWQIEHAVLAGSWQREHATTGCAVVAVGFETIVTRPVPVGDEPARAVARIPALASASVVTRWPTSAWHVAQGAEPACFLWEKRGPLLSRMRSWHRRQRASGTSAVPWGKRGSPVRWTHSSWVATTLCLTWLTVPASTWQSTQSTLAWGDAAHAS